MMALTALSIDLVLPAFDEVRGEFGLAADSPETASIITAFLLGLAVPQLVYGPLSDRFGRKPLLYAGFVLFAVGAVISATAGSLGTVLVGRFIWGLGAAGPRVITLSVIRDTFEGERMARVMSFIMAIFIIIPIIAPSIGAGIVAVAPWRGVFWFCVAYLGVVVVWVTRLPETLDPAHRIEVSFAGIRSALSRVLESRQTMGYLATMTFINGVFASYLASSELIWTEVFDRGDAFPLIFGGLAAVLGAAMFANGFIVGRIGIRRLVHRALAAYVAGAAGLAILALVTDGRPSFWAFLVVLAVPVGLMGLLIPNLNTLAMTPVGDVAGTASGVIGTVATAAGAGLGFAVDRSFDGTVVPLSVAFVIAGALALIAVGVTERGKLQLRSRRLDPAAMAPPLVD
jgi:DHA1 family bicyclomycin/chloramphenicol resistance-like MFS transporter